MFSVELSRAAKKGLGNCPEEYAARIKELLLILREKPYPFRMYDLRKIKGRNNVYRIRIGKWRIQYEVFRKEKFALVFSIEKKGETTYK